MENKILILDFDAFYKNTEPGENAIVLSSGYENSQTFDVRKFKAKLDADVDAFSAQWEELIQRIPESYRNTLRSNQAPFFRGCLSPLSRWMEAIDHVMENNSVSEIVFSSYTDNDKMFVYEAEGEINKKFMYQGNAYFPYYLKLYIQRKFQRDVTISRMQDRSKIRRKHRMRNFVLFHFIVLKQVAFKLTTFKRNYGIEKKAYKTILSSRAVVQTEFISNYQKVSGDAVLIANEQSFSLLKHLKFLKGTQRKFIYAEGMIKFSDLFGILGKYFKDLRRAKKMKDLGITYHGIHFSASLFLPDLLTKGLDYTFYATSVKNAVRRYTQAGEASKMISFEMFTSYAGYLKEITQLPTVQVQTTLIEPVRNTDFIVSDFFYFTNPVSYNDFRAKNPLLENRLGCIPYLKYLGCEKKILGSEVKSIVYFTQPIDFDEENEIIATLEDYSMKNDVKLTIKPHPRQLTPFNLKSEKTVISGPAEDVEKLMLEADVIITRSSSIGLDAWIYGVPPIFAKLNKPLQSHNIFYAPNDYAGTIFNLGEMNGLLDNYTELKKQFLGHPLFGEVNQINNIQAESLFSI